MKYKILVVLGLGLLCTHVYAENGSSTAVPASSSVQSSESTEVKNKMQSEAFLAENKTKQGIVTLADGLQYKVLVEGKGVKPTLNDMVTVNYSGTLIDGTEFDSSYKRGEPATFPVSGVIQGWVEALQLMNMGSTWELYIPSDLAYGKEGAPPSIGPNQALIFKVELLDVKNP